MKLNHIIKGICGVALLFAAVAFTSCTSEFNKWNTNPDAASEDQMQSDNLMTGSYFANMQHNVFVVGANKGGDFQMIDMLVGGLYSGYISNIKNAYDIGSVHNAHYAFPTKWLNAPFNNAYTNVMENWYQLTLKAEEAQTPAVAALATIVKVFAMSRVTDMYGPIPYTDYGGKLKVAYDSQEKVYKTFFTELDNSINLLTEYLQAGSTSILKDYDYVYGGNVESWLKFANTLRLRLALRVAYANASLAKAQAQAAIDNAYGFIELPAEAPYHTQSTKFSFINPYWEVCTSFGDMRMCASFESYLNGYADPRAAAYFKEAVNGGGIHGVYPGLSSINQTAYSDYTSSMNFEQSSPMQWMSAAESFFLRAEAKLRWDLGSASAQSLYESGIETSFQERSVSGAAAYIANSTAVPADFADNSNQGSWYKNDAAAVGNVTIAWNEGDNFETKLEKIITQKWIAIYPDGQEAWSEYRRTGYPHLFTVASNQSGGTVDTDLQVRRLKFAPDEFSNNAANVQAAVGLLGGQDTGGTKLWWDKNPRH